MRQTSRRFVVAAAAAFVAVLAASALHAQDEEDEGDDAETRKIAQEHLSKSVARGKELFASKALGKKSCAQCHEDPEKPNLNLATREYSYPAYSVKKKAVLSMGQKINEMLTGRSRGKEMELGSADIVALEAYMMSLKRK
jgi:cytochrome c